ncbi:MAG: Ig domain-containing protein, partial [Betaproteobacteria bacterium]|nr:Ig domain-containing protein [Betaproteobacteria bacterium]
GFSLAAGSTLPAGLSLASDGTISGTPTTAVAGASFSVTVTDADSDTATASYTITIASSTPPGPGPAPSPVPTPTPEPPFSDGGSLSPGGSYSAPAGDVSFCLGSPGSAPVTVRIDNVPYTIAPLAENTCFEIVGNGNVRDLILDSGSVEISSLVPGSPLLEARNGDLVTGNGRIRATVDPVCTSTRVMILEGNVKAPEWILAPPPNTGCPADALTPEQGQFILSGGKLACNAGALSLKGPYAHLTLKETQQLATGQQFFTVAGNAVYGWFQQSYLGWVPLGDPFLPLYTAGSPGPKTATLVDGLDLRGIPGIELYIGFGVNANEMLMNERYCGVFRVAP